MISRDKVTTNRANARKSTGPKTAQGRSRSARNALRHGLSLSVFSDTSLSKEVEALARELAGADAGPEIQELARPIAEAQIDLRRVRYAHHALLSNALCDPNYKSGDIKAKHERICPLASSTGLVTPVPDEAEGPLKLAEILSKMARALLAMERYERRALSRRKFAIRAFDAARSTAVTAVRPNAFDQ
jgi:hypothetical protein